MNDKTLIENLQPFFSFDLITRCNICKCDINNDIVNNIKKDVLSNTISSSIKNLKICNNCSKKSLHLKNIKNFFNRQIK